MLTGIHILLTYQCTFECDHCFLFSGPFAGGTMTLPQVRSVLEESKKIGTIETIYFEGGEPFLLYRSMLEGIKLAKEMGFKVGIVTNSYWAISDEDAEVCLKPLLDFDVDLSVSDDSFHFGEGESPAKRALAAAQRLGYEVDSICIQKPYLEADPGEGLEKGTPVIMGGAMFKGRAVEKLTEGLPLTQCSELTTCSYEDLETPSRVHVDPYGHVHICQGVSMGNMWEKPLSELVRDYDPASHPICGPLIRGGPELLAKEYGVEVGKAFVDECHYCYLVRRALIDKFPEYLAPRQVYGFEKQE